MFSVVRLIIVLTLGFCQSMLSPIDMGGKAQNQNSFGFTYLYPSKQLLINFVTKYTFSLQSYMFVLLSEVTNYIL